MKLCSVFLLMLSSSFLYLHSTMGSIKHGTYAGNNNLIASTMCYLEKLLCRGDGVQRKELREVHSGPNPIGNYLTSEWKMKPRKNP